MSQLNQQQINQNVSGQSGQRLTIDERIQKNEDLGLDDDDSDDGDSKPEKRTGRRKIKIEFIEDKSRRHITFSKRKAGIMKKVCNSFQTFLLLYNKNIAMFTRLTNKLFQTYLGVRVIDSNWNSGATFGSLRNWSSIYLYNSKITAFGNQTRRKEFDSNMLECT
jgi:hypothetical protein